MFGFDESDVLRGGVLATIVSAPISRQLWQGLVAFIWGPLARKVSRHAFLTSKTGQSLSTTTTCYIQQSYIIVEIEPCELVHDELVVDDRTFSRSFEMKRQQYLMSSSTMEAVSLTKMLNVFWNERSRIAGDAYALKQLDAEISRILARVGADSLNYN